MKLNSEQQLRIDILSKFIAGNIHYLDAMELLKIRERQFRRQVKSFRERGIESVIHGNIGRSPSNKISDSTRFKVKELYRGRFRGLNLIHFQEKLIEEGITNPPCYSTLRNILLEEKLISIKVRRRKRVHPMRKRYEKEGMMVQIDGSHHRWLPNKLPLCLTLAMDDATGKILAAKFTPTETTFAAMDVVEKIIRDKGRFQMLYSDRAGIYGGGKRDGYSQMNSALKQLDILSIQANTPQAKGRVERVFRTLQSRLVSEIRLKGIRTQEEANKYLNEEFIDEFNTKFGVEAVSKESAYKCFDKTIDLNEVFCLKDSRVVQEGHIVSYRGKRLLLNLGRKESFIREQVEIREYRDGTTRLFLKGKEVDYEYFDERMAA
ncbi:ISNCY family transposase [Halobacteriovorax sp.]|uniref:ISNCY family transposase n=1 Tax=Halobacteriovorax sp. TaxID=2020862 RepID=UPI00356518EA